mmetsp:Transcript_31161/g.47662  ORF Transcript_31161/g.47662 Transcript_31161/m.47662 type:complete len:219 (-) Transcript_31161:387-1043(-)
MHVQGGVVRRDYVVVVHHQSACSLWLAGHLRNLSTGERVHGHLLRGLHRLLHLKLRLQLLVAHSLLGQTSLPLQKPLGVAVDLIDGNVQSGTAHIGLVLANFQLLLVHEVILLMHFPHLFDFVKVYDEATLVGVVLLDALSAEDGEMVRAVEVLHTLVVFVAYQAVDALLVFEVDVPQNWVSFYNFVEDVKVQRQLVYSLHLLNQFPTNGAPDFKIVV